MRKFTLTLILVILFSEGSHSQSCLPEGITFTTQAQVDSFQVNYPGCTEIEGDVFIQEKIPSDIINLNGLIQLTSIGGDLTIYSNDSLSNLLGLDSLSYIGGSVTLSDNDALYSFSGLEKLTYIGQNLTIGSTYPDGNPSVINDLMGLRNLNFIGGDLSIYYNGPLIDLAGLDNVTNIRGDLKIRYNLELTTLTGLEGLHSIPDGYIDIWSNNALLNLTGLENITKIDGQFNLVDNEALVCLDGIERLSSMWGNLYIQNNPSLGNISGLSGLYIIAGNLIIKNNNMLESLSGLDNVSKNSIGNLEIIYNESLSDCEVASICDYLAEPNGTIEIHDNAPGCNSQEEVEAACGVGIEESLVGSRKSSVNIYPNPAHGMICIDIPGSNSGFRVLGTRFQVSIFDYQGREVIHDQSAAPLAGMDVSALSEGIYYVRVIMEDEVRVGRFIKR